MNKAEFLHILRENLSILDENELEDILNEYEQHIDMKAAGAMSEEAAIADFGDIGELTADILEAYHVRADYAQNQEAEEDEENILVRFAGGIWDTLQKAFSAVTRGFAKGGKSLWKNFLAALAEIGRFFQESADKCGAAFGKLFARRKSGAKPAEMAIRDKEIPEKRKLLPVGRGDHEEKRDKMEKKKKITLFSVMGSMCRGCANAAVWCAKAIWNIICACIGIMMGIFASACIFILGTLIVLLVMGYPLLGITLAFLGLTMCTCSVTILCFTLMIRRRRQAEDAAQKEEIEDGREEEIVHA